MKYYGYIYKTTNLINGKIYIGQHKGLFNPSYLGSGYLLKDALVKYGKHNFKVEPVDYAVNKDQLDGLEIMHIDAEKRIHPEMIYNISPGGQGGYWGQSGPGEMNGMFGKKHSDETRKKISKNKVSPKGVNHYAFGKKRREESKRKQGESRKGTKCNVGRVLSAETKEKIRQSQISFYKNHDNPFKGKKHSLETREKMRKPHKKRSLPTESSLCA